MATHVRVSNRLYTTSDKTDKGTRLYLNGFEKRTVNGGACVCFHW